MIKQLIRAGAVMRLPFKATKLKVKKNPIKGMDIRAYDRTKQIIIKQLLTNQKYG